MVIMAFISLGIIQATTETFKLRDVLSVEGDFYNAIRLATDIIRRDTVNLYSPEMLIPKRSGGSLTDGSFASRGVARC